MCRYTYKYPFMYLSESWYFDSLLTVLFCDFHKLSTLGTTCLLSNVPCWLHIRTYVQCSSVPRCQRSLVHWSQATAGREPGFLGAWWLHGARDSYQSITDDNTSSSCHGIWEFFSPRHLVSPCSLNKSGQSSSIRVTFPPPQFYSPYVGEA